MPCLPTHAELDAILRDGRGGNPCLSFADMARAGIAHGFRPTIRGDLMGAAEGRLLADAFDRAMIHAGAEARACRFGC